MKFPRFLTLALATLMLLTFCDVLAACPNCKNAVAQTSDATAVAFAWSIGLMLLAPAAILGSWLAVYWWSQRCQICPGPGVGRHTAESAAARRPVRSATA